MKKLVSGLLLAAAFGIGTAHADPVATPAMGGSIANNPSPLSFDSGFGAITVTGAVSGLAQYQSNATHLAAGDGSSTLDLSNGWVAIQKSSGLVQFYVQAGLYSFPTVGAPYEKSDDTGHDTFGYVPIAYLKLQLSDSFSVQAGKLPTLVGAELPTTVQNINIERGLLWFQEPLVSRGVQVNYASGAFSLSLSWNDGGYTNVWNTFSGLASYSFGDAGTLAVDASIAPARDFVAGSQIYDLMYSVTSGAWFFGPYLQYQHYDATKAGGVTLSPSASDWGIGALANYTISDTWSLGLRAEYEDSSGSGSAFIYGPGSNAWSFTATPTWKKGIFFIRGEASYTTVGDYFKTPGFGSGFGKTGTKSDQFRALLETGIVF
jgi:hypothetical protein